ncbi:UNVERIFIED_CONTAM: LRR receptor-like serine/threonine-protein kinase [Sesamum radiatum]|uniref:LRR receptor-like serine/threonine-protein kinase n=1 Tax=Sesamum radiatum TaxID=300843 RepID=A0AAW2T2A0_SESRA
MPAPLSNPLPFHTVFSFTLLLFIASLLFLSCYSIDEQGQALLAWKNRLNDSTNALNSWNSLDQNPCTWFGIHCNSNGDVEKKFEVRRPAGALAFKFAASQVLEHSHSLISQYHRHDPERVWGLS